MALATAGKSTRVELVEGNESPLGHQLVSARKTNKMYDPTDLVELAKGIQKADEFTRANAGNKLTVIADQIRYLQEQARKVLEEAKLNADLHHAACNIVKKPGTMYYLYERESGQKYFSILSPEEWGARRPHEFCGAYRLEYDQSFTPQEYCAKKSEEMAIIDKVLNKQMAIADSATEFGKKRVPSQPTIIDVSTEGMQTDS